MDVGSLEGGTLSPIIMEVEPGGIWKVTAIGGTYFSPCLWEEGYWVTRIKYWLGGFKDYWFFILPLFYLGTWPEFDELIFFGIGGLSTK